MKTNLRMDRKTNTLDVNLSFISNLRKEYQFVSKLILYSSILGLVEMVFSPIYTLKTCILFDAFHHDQPSELLELNLIRIQMIFGAIYGFLLGSLYSAARGRFKNAVYNGLLLATIIIIKYIFILRVSGGYKYVIFYYPFSLGAIDITLLFVILQGWLKQNLKIGLFALLGFIILTLLPQPYYNFQYIMEISYNNNKESYNGLFAVLSSDVLLLQKLTYVLYHLRYFFYPVLFWYFIIIFESLGYNEEHKKLFKRVFEVKRRVDRKNFTIYFIISALYYLYIYYCLMVEVVKNGIDNIDEFIPMLILLLVITTINILLMIKRFHDSNESGWYILLGFVPIVNLFLYYLMFKKGDNKPNKYGEPLVT